VGAFLLENVCVLRGRTVLGLLFSLFLNDFVPEKLYIFLRKKAPKPLKNPWFYAIIYTLSIGSETTRKK
jgi:hypothetical protein